MLLFSNIWTDCKLMYYLGALLIISSLIMGHFTSSPTERKPLPSSIYYNYDVRTSQAKWVTNDDHVNIGNESFLENATYSKINPTGNTTKWNVDTETKPHVSIPEITIDSIDPNVVHIITPDEKYKTTLVLEQPSNIDTLFLNNQEVIADYATEKRFLIEAIAMAGDTLTVRLDRDASSNKQLIRIISYFRSLPGKDKLPGNAVRNDGYTSIVQEFEM